MSPYSYELSQWRSNIFMLILPSDSVGLRHQLFQTQRHDLEKLPGKMPVWLSDCPRLDQTEALRWEASDGAEYLCSYLVCLPGICVHCGADTEQQVSHWDTHYMQHEYHAGHHLHHTSHLITWCLSYSVCPPTQVIPGASSLHTVNR